MNWWKNEFPTRNDIGEAASAGRFSSHPFKLRSTDSGGIPNMSDIIDAYGNLPTTEEDHPPVKRSEYFSTDGMRVVSADEVDWAQAYGESEGLNFKRWMQSALHHSALDDCVQDLG